MLREIVLDTETTGLDAARGDRIIEIGCVELLNHIPTGRTWHRYINPERPVSEGAVAVHGLTDEFLKDKELFAQVAEEFCAFVEDARLVIHNAAFDTKFLNAELARVGRPALLQDLVVDTLILARRRHPGAENNLDALCRRYGIDNSRRTKHGALLDAEILADLYIELIGGRQADLGLGPVLSRRDGTGGLAGSGAILTTRPAPLAPRLSESEIAAHETFIAGLGDAPLWRDYLEPRD